jgi:hypothetical protein
VLRLAALALAATAGCGFEAVYTGPPSRPVSPLSTSTVASQRPTLRWSLPPGGSAPRVVLCRARACTDTEAAVSIDGTLTSATPIEPLAPGLWFWRVYASTPDGPSVSPTWMLRVLARSGPRDSHWGSVLDRDGDGIAELAVGAHFVQGPGDLGGRGRVYIHHGTAQGPDRSVVDVIDGPSDGALFGRSLAACDVDGDGLPDLVVGATNVPRGDGNLRGRVYVQLSGRLPASELRGLDVGGAHSFGWSVACAGDVNGDGYGDLIIGAPLTITAPMTIGTGTAYVFYGSGDGLLTKVTPIVVPEADMSKVGISVAGVGDLDGDGFDDMVIGVPDGAVNGKQSGRAYIVRGDAAGVILSDHEPVENPIDHWTRFGSWVSAAGDLDEDGYPDFLVGAPNGGAGRVHIYRGGAKKGTGAALARTIDGPDGDDGRFGATISAGSDYDGDGRPDAAIAATCAPTMGPCGPGRVYLLRGDPSQLLVFDSTVSGAIAAQRFGEGLLASSDLDGDGLSDLAIGSPAFMGELGRVDVHASRAPALSLIGSDAAGHFGAALR